MYLIFDIETYPDKQLQEHVEGPRSEWTEDELKEFPHPVYHVPIAAAVITADDNLMPRNYGFVAHLVSDEKKLLLWFWAIFKKLFSGTSANHGPCFVTYNGRGFDLPVLELRSLKHKISVPHYFDTSNKWDNYRKKYSSVRHFDLAEFLTNFGATKRPHLDAVASMVGLPGKSVMSGDRVEAEYDAGHLEQIKNYCLHDVWTTYAVLIRTHLLRGEITPSQYLDVSRACAQKLDSRPELTFLGDIGDYFKSESVRGVE